MAIVKYRCDVCKRTIELQQNIHGLETPSRCIITHGCRGKLYFKQRLPDFVRGSPPEDVLGLDNWQQRRVLFNHEQAIARIEWIIEHNLGNSANVSAFVNQPTTDNPDNLVEIEPDDIIIDSPDIMRLIFSRPYSGKAQLIARASDPQLLQQTTTSVITATELRQLSSLGEISVATRIDGILQPDIQLRLTFATSQETTQQLDYLVDDAPSIISPWNDFDRIIINNVLYIVRSFKGTRSEMDTGVIGNGSTFIFTSIDDDNTGNFRTIEPNEVFLLLSTTPFTNIDKVVDNIIDVTDINDTTNTFALAYDTGEFFGDSVVEQTIYPPIREA